jgi:hypothetical protein
MHKKYIKTSYQLQISINIILKNKFKRKKNNNQEKKKKDQNRHPIFLYKKKE